VVLFVNLIYDALGVKLNSNLHTPTMQNILKKITKSTLLLSLLFILSGLVDSPSAQALTNISNCTELQAMNNSLAEDYSLSQNIDCSDTVNWNSGAGFVPIGDSSTNFTGTFDGSGYEIQNLYINRPTTDNVGLFGYAYEATISDVDLTNVRIKGQNNVGAVGGIFIRSVTASNLSSSGEVRGQNLVGGLIGDLNHAGSALYTCYLDNSHSSADVFGKLTVGGLMGRLYGSHMDECYATGKVRILTEDGDQAGGLIGGNYGAVTESYSTSDVFAFDDNVGGLAGYNNTGSINDSYSLGNTQGDQNIGSLLGGTINQNAPINRTYSIGNVRGRATLGGITGSNPFSSTITDSFWDTLTTNLSNACGSGTCSSGVTGTVSSVLEQEATFQTAWDFIGDADPDNIWKIDEGSTYPCLAWQTTCPTPPAVISDCAGLQNMANDLNGNYLVVADIDCAASSGWNSGAGFDPIGSSSTPFTGILDANGHTIADLYIDRAEDYVGLFGYTNGALIENINFTGVDITGANYTGTIAGQANNSIIQYVSSVGDIASDSESDKSGGLVGAATSSSEINYSLSEVEINGGDQVGGIAGYLSDSQIKDSYASVNAAAIGSNQIGGLVGDSYGSSSITNSYSRRQSKW
jgi:hypothetical protein